MKPMHNESDTVIRSGDIAEPSMPFGICGLLLLYITGISDDLIGERYKAKLAMQIAAAGLMLCSGLCICNLHGLDIMKSPTDGMFFKTKVHNFL